MLDFQENQGFERNFKKMGEALYIVFARKKEHNI